MNIRHPRLPSKLSFSAIQPRRSVFSWYLVFSVTIPFVSHSKLLSLLESCTHCPLRSMGSWWMRSSWFRWRHPLSFEWSPCLLFLLRFRLFLRFWRGIAFLCLLVRFLESFHDRKCDDSIPKGVCEGCSSSWCRFHREHQSWSVGTALFGRVLSHCYWSWSRPRNDGSVCHLHSHGLYHWFHLRTVLWS